MSAGLVRPIENVQDIVDVILHAITMVQFDLRESSSKEVGSREVDKPLVIAELESVLDFFGVEYTSDL